MGVQDPTAAAAPTLAYSSLQTRSFAWAIIFGVLSVSVGITGAVVGFSLAYLLNDVPPGTAIRPIDLYAYIMLTIMASVILGTIFGCVCIKKACGRASISILGLLGIALSIFAPYRIPKAELSHVIAKNHSIEEE